MLNWVDRSTSECHKAHFIQHIFFHVASCSIYLSRIPRRPLLYEELCWNPRCSHRARLFNLIIRVSLEGFKI